MSCIHTYSLKKGMVKKIPAQGDNNSVVMEEIELIESIFSMISFDTGQQPNFDLTRLNGVHSVLPKGSYTT